MRNACIGAPPETSTDAVPSTCPPYMPVRDSAALRSPLVSVACTAIGAKRKRADVQLGGGKLHVGVDIVQPGEADRLAAPGLARLRLRPAAARRGGSAAARRGMRRHDVEPLHVEIPFDEELARKVERHPSVQLARADLAGEPVDPQYRSGEADIARAGERALQKAGRLERKIDRHVRPLEARERRLGRRLQPNRLIARIGTSFQPAFICGERCGESDAVDTHLHAVSRIRHHDGAVFDDQAIHRESGRRGGAAVSRRRGGAPRTALALAQQRGAQHRLHDRDLGDPRPAGKKARERERHPHALRRKAGRGVLPLPSSRLIRLSVTVGDGRNANFVSPSMRSRYPVRLSI